MADTNELAEQIAKQLTERMRDALYFPNGYRDPNTSKAMRRRGLIIGGALTPLGIEVRASLRALAKGEGNDARQSLSDKVGG